MSSDESDIREVIGTWFAATREGDVQKVLSLMAEDVVFLVAGREPFGKEEFAAASREMTSVELDGRSDVEEIKILGDWAVARTHITLDVTPATGKSVRRSGYTLSLYHKQPDGAWQLARDANLLTTE